MLLLKYSGLECIQVGFSLCCNDSARGRLWSNSLQNETLSLCLAEIGLTQTLECPSADREVTCIPMYTTCNLILLKFGGLEGIQGVIQSLLQWFWVERRLWPILSKLRSRSSWRGALSILKAMGGLHASMYNRNLMLLRSERIAQWEVIRSEMRRDQAGCKYTSEIQVTGHKNQGCEVCNAVLASICVPYLLYFGYLIPSLRMGFC